MKRLAKIARVRFTNTDASRFDFLLPSSRGPRRKATTMSSAMRKTTTTPRARRLAASAIALGTFLALALPAASAGAAPADPVRTVFFDDSYTANFGAAEAAGPAFLAQTMFSSTVHST